MATNKYKRYSISLDQTSHGRCKALADERATSVSGVLRILIRDAFRQRIQQLKIRDDGRSLPY